MAIAADTIGEAGLHLHGRARSLADLRRLRHRRGQCARLQRRAAHGRARKSRNSRRSTSRRRPARARPTCCTRSAMPISLAHPRARIFYCSAERFMVEFVQALKSEPDDRIQGAAAQLRPAAGGRYPVHHRQGQRAGRTALHDRCAAGRRQAAGVRRRPRAAGAGRGRAAPAQPPVDGSRRRHPARRYRTAPQDPRDPS